MSSKDRLVLLADKLDAKGLSSEASVVDELIVKRSFDEDTRTNLRSVIESINQLVEELSEATKGQRLQNKTTGEWFTQGGLEPDKQDFFNERLERIQQAVGYISDLNEELEDDTPWPEEDVDEDATGEDATGEDATGEDATGEDAEKEPWWEKMREKIWGPPTGDDDAGGFDPEDETTLPNPGPDRRPDDEFDNEFREEEFGSDTGTVRRTRGGGVTVEQSMSNIGNVNIGE